MSQVVTRKSAISDEKEKRTDSPVKDMKKKVAANAEKEKQTSEKTTEKQPEKTEKLKLAEKPTEKSEKSAEKPKQVEKPAEKNDKQKQPEKGAEKDKSTEKAEKSSDKKVEKNGVDNKKTDNKEKKETQEKKDDKADKNSKAEAKKNVDKPKQNGSKHNGVGSNGVEEAASDDDVLEIADDEFPELAYDDTSDNESPTPDCAPSRSTTRRSQPKDKVLKLSEAPPTDRKLRSDDPKTEKKQDKKDAEKKENGEDKDDVIEIDADDEPRKTDTNYSKSRVKVSPYRRSSRLADNTASSVMANYTGNNTTMEMDITESSSFAEEGSLDDSTYLNGLRSIRGRRSYKPLKELSLKHINRSVRSTTSTSVIESRPTGTVVGRKRKPESDDGVELGTEASELSSAVHGKRMRLLERIAQPFRRTIASTPIPSRRNPEIVGINTDLPLSAPVSAPPSFDPESLKAAPSPALASPETLDGDKKRCIVM